MKMFVHWIDPYTRFAGGYVITQDMPNEIKDLQEAITIYQPVNVGRLHVIAFIDRVTRRTFGIDIWLDGKVITHREHIEGTTGQQYLKWIDEKTKSILKQEEPVKQARKS